MNEPENIEPILKNEKALVVDDIERWLGVATNNLTYYGCVRENILLAYNIKDGERIYLAEKPSLNFIDINFEVGNLKDTQGLDLISKIRKYDSNIPIVAMSSLRYIEDRVLEAGASYFINKENFTGDFDNFVEWYKKR